MFKNKEIDIFVIDEEGEDRLLGQAIEEGRSSESVSRDELDKVLYDRSPDAVQTDPA